jgi:hypothetical protein
MLGGRNLKEGETGLEYTASSIAKLGERATAPH